MLISVTINGKKYTDEVSADLVLLDYLREKGCLSVKRGCETSNCGLCTVHLDGKPILSITVGDKIRDLPSCSKFLTFNYTETLEKIFMNR